MCAAPLTAQTLTAWDSPIKVIAADGALTKSAGCEGCPDAGAHSATQLTGDGYAEFVPAAGQRVIAGLGTDLSASTDSSTIDYAFSLWPGGAWEVRERGVYKTDGASAAGDRFRVSVESGRVVYRRNGAVVYTSATPPSYPLVLDVTLYSMAASISGATVVITTTVPVIPPPPPPPPGQEPTGPPVVTTTGPYQAVTDRYTHVKPALPVMGPAGSTITDPVFLSPITRITDGSTRHDTANRSYRTPSSPHQNAWSATGSRFYVVSTDGSVLPYRFDSTTGSAQRIDPTSSGAGGFVLSFYVEPQFSYVRDSVIYGSYSGPGGASLRTIDQYDFTTRSYSRLLDLDAVVPGLAGTYIGGVASSAGTTERVMTFFGGSRQDLHHYVAVFEATNPQNRQLLDTTASTVNGSPTRTALNFLLHHAMIDRSGRYVMLYPTSADQTGPRKAPQSVLWDTQANVFTEMPVSALPYGHDAFGYGVSVNKDCCTSSAYDAGQWQFRSLAAPLVTRDLITTILPVKEVYMADHQTWNNARPDNSAPFISGTYRHGGNPAPVPRVGRRDHRGPDRRGAGRRGDGVALRAPSQRRHQRLRRDRGVVLVHAAAQRLARRPLGALHLELGEDARHGSHWRAGDGRATGCVPRRSEVERAAGGDRGGAARLRARDRSLRGRLERIGWQGRVRLGGHLWRVAGGPDDRHHDRRHLRRAGDRRSLCWPRSPWRTRWTCSNSASASVDDHCRRAACSRDHDRAACGTRNDLYTSTAQASGGVGSVIWSIASGSLPAGLTLNAGTGAIAGNPTSAGTYDVGLAATDTSDPTNVATAPLTIAIAGAVKVVSPRTLPAQAKGVFYSYALQAVNVQGTAVWNLQGGALPPGITLNPATGVLSGTCLTTGAYYFNARVKDTTTDDTLTLALDIR